MIHELVLERFAQYLTELADACRTHPLIDGLVLMGSTAERTRVDEWSDHDFAVVCASGVQETLRRDLAWLPLSTAIAFIAREDHNGFKGVYRTGAVIEFAVVDRDELSTFHANAWEVAYDERGDLTELMSSVAAKRKPNDQLDPARDFSVFLASLLIGVGRARRGEVLSASAVVRGQAVDHLLLTLNGVDEPDSRSDNLDARRRFEETHAGLQLGQLLDTDVETAARELLNSAEAALASRWLSYPTADVATVRDRLGWRP